MSGRYVILRDRRLQGGVPFHENVTIANTDASTSLGVAFHQINLQACVGKIDTLFILCHGYAGSNPRLGMSVDGGGMGLQLGREDLTVQNVGQWLAINNKVSNIVIYACAAADTQPGNKGTDADGQYLMGALALATRADVYAATAMQWYRTYRGLQRGSFHFEAWSGLLFRFSGRTGNSEQVLTVPTDLGRVLNGH
ncbi:MAG TPA: hypothetical protein VKZ18_00205 [Polyangia bacterium]|nr:hypothetical protein [Polyangia bacterium]